MTPRRSSGGPQCAFEENKKERERREGERARELSPEKEPPGAASPNLAGTAGPPGGTLVKGGGGDLGSRGARSDPAQRGAGCDLCFGGLHF
jgi:hypothetical protein|uniref:SMAD family member 6 n=1 Tax=Mus musculus TaxID=10090 RepID=J3QPR3_MOUSE